MSEEEKEPVKKKTASKKAAATTEKREGEAAPAKRKKAAEAPKDETPKEETTPPAPLPEENVVVTEFKSPFIDVKLETRPFCRVKLIIDAKAELVKNARKNALRNIAKEVSIPGFRKGKAPDALIEKKFPGAVAKNWEQAFADLAFVEGQKLAKVVLLGGDSKISYQVNKLTQEGGEISFSFESEPVIPDIDYTKLKLPTQNKKEEVTPEKIDETLKHIQMFYARWQQITDRPVKEGDYVVLDIDDVDSNTPVQAFSNARFEVAKGKMADWMRELVLGKKLDEHVEGVSTPDAHESETVKKEFKSKKVKIHIKGIEEPTLPELNDEFALKLGTKNLGELKERLTNLLTKQEEERRRNHLRDEIADELIEKFPFDIPASVLEKEANYRITQLFKTPGFAREWKEQMTEDQKSEKKEAIKKESIEILKVFYISRKIAAENKLELSEEELAPQYENILDMMFADPETVNYKNRSKEQQAIAFSKYMIAKSLDFIVSKVTG